MVNVERWLAEHVGRPLREPRALRAMRAVAGVYWVALAVGTHWPRLTLMEDDAGVLQLNKAMHVTAFAGLTLLLALARPAGRQRRWVVQTATACLIAGGYALVDEWTQAFADRNVGLADIVANLIGIIGMYLVLTAPRPGGPAWPTHLVRAGLLLGGPVLFLITILPIGHDVLENLARLVVTPRAWMGWWLHLVTALGVTGLLTLAMVAGRSRPKLSALLTIAGMGLAGPMMELIQDRTGRSYNVDDVYANAWGLLLAMAVWAGLVAWRTLPMPDRLHQPTPATAKRQSVS